MPRPEWRPVAERGPRPSRLRSVRGCAGWRFSSESFFSGIFDLHEVADTAEHAVEHGARLLLDRAADLAEPEGSKSPAMAPALADLAFHLRDAHLGHVRRRPSSCGLSDAWASLR